MKNNFLPCLINSDLTPSQAKLYTDIIKSEDGHVLLHKYHKNTIKALAKKGIITILMYKRYGSRDSKVIRLRKGNECQNIHLI